jgi:hypothetical protein
MRKGLTFLCLYLCLTSSALAQQEKRVFSRGGESANWRRASAQPSTDYWKITATVDRPVAAAVLVTDQSVPQGAIDRIRAEAQADGVNLILLGTRFASGYFRERYLRQLVNNNLELIQEANLLLVATADAAGLYALLELGQKPIKLNTARVVIAGGFARPVGRVMGWVLFTLLEPTEVVLIHHPADLLSLWETARVRLLNGASMAEGTAKWEVTPTVIREGAQRLSRWRRWLVGVWASAVQAQVPLSALNFILLLPLIAFFIVIARNVVGMETFGTFSPMFVSLAFLTTGLGWGIVIFVVIVGLGTVLRMVLQRLRLQPISRMAILITVVAVSMVGLTVAGAILGIGMLLHISVFPMVIMANVIENFTYVQLEQGTRVALRLTLNTLLVAAGSYGLIENTSLKPLILAFPETIAGVVVVEILLGRWRGLRLLEYFRFYGLVRERKAQWSA